MKAIDAKRTAAFMDQDAKQWEFDAAEYGVAYPQVVVVAAQKRQAADEAIRDFQKLDAEASETKD